MGYSRLLERAEEKLEVLGGSRAVYQEPRMTVSAVTRISSGRVSWRTRPAFSWSSGVPREHGSHVSGFELRLRLCGVAFAVSWRFRGCRMTKGRAGGQAGVQFVSFSSWRAIEAQLRMTHAQKEAATKTLYQAQH